MRTFKLHRAVDGTGLSGTGIVAEGGQFKDGSVALRWLQDSVSPENQARGVRPTTVIHESIESVVALHGHQGTTVRWDDDPMPRTYSAGDVIPVTINGVKYPTEIDRNGVQRFIPNAIVADIITRSHVGGLGGWTLNDVSYTPDHPYSLDDLIQFGTLHGYSVAGLCDLSFMEGVVIDNPLWPDV